ncbi:MFS transporter [Reticulibacter mediterranei]|uniref:MFS transporter n=1 Tax=Reticulibacter mediterranei TaxID=2778369 RepID=A0A8J3IUM7_9CHLR|nr:MFS transporter [Reticulibacter mediterranei]GHO98194.1 MFS transporter [Reticulibacter mediterranei]
MFSPSLRLSEGRIRSIGLIALSCGFFMVLLDSTVLNVALPSIEHTFGGSLESLQWTVNSYTLLFASLLLTGGALADSYGSRRIFCLGLLIFSVASLLCSFATSISLLIGARVLQGIGAAILVPASLSLITHLFSDAKERAKAVSIWAGIASLAVASGPLIGGILVDTFGWRSVFLVNVPFGGAAVLLTYLSIPPTPVQKRGLDLPGQILAIISCCALTYGLIEWGHVAPALIAASFGVALIAGGAFIMVEARSSQPMMPLSLLRSWDTSATLLIGLLYQFSFYGLLFVFALFFQNTYHFNAITTGLAFLPQTAVGSFLLLFVTGRLMRRMRSSTMIVLSMILASAGMLVILLGVHTTFPVVMSGEALIGVCVGFIVSPMTALVLVNTPKEQSGIASALLNAARQIGGVLGVALLGAALGNSATVAGMQSALLIMGGACMIGLLLSISLARRENARVATVPARMERELQPINID